MFATAEYDFALRIQSHNNAFQEKNILYHHHLPNQTLHMADQRPFYSPPQIALQTLKGLQPPV